MLSTTEVARESRARRAVAKEGYVLRKNRQRGEQEPGYALIDPGTNVAVFGWDWDLDLDDVERWLKD